MEIKDIMKSPVVIDMDCTLGEVVESMAQKGVNSILVTGENGELIGIVDVVTLMNTIVPEYVGNRDKSVAGFIDNNMFKDFIADNRDKKVKYFMHSEPKTINVNSSVLSACIKVTEGRQTRVPVIDDNKKPLWVFTREWVKRYLAETMWFECNCTCK